jgi:Histidine kinase-, DNA gyrase B-, and HSP90-like ATPase
MNKNASADPVLRINIRPEVTILSVLQHLNYRPWFALAEFVDNALQSFVSNREAINAAEGSATSLRVEIDLESDGPGYISIRDNAAGISLEDFPRAFRPAEIPPNRTGLSEFGMGMKSAACWFARKWVVRTKALGEVVERTVEFDIETIISQRTEEMTVRSRPEVSPKHYTEVQLYGLHHPPRGRAVGKIKEHLGSIYRNFIRSGELQLVFRNELLEFIEPAVLTAPFFREPAGTPRTWRKEIAFDFGCGQRVTGFAALRQTASTPYAGFALFRRGRLIEGSADETYRPPAVFGPSNSYRYQRLFGELHLEGFEVSHTKDGFRWEEYEEVFLDLLREHLEAPPLNLLAQAEGFRSRAVKSQIEPTARKATETVAKVVQEDAPPVVSREAATSSTHGLLPLESPPDSYEIATRTVRASFSGQQWEVTVRTSIDPARGDWLRIAERFDRPDQGQAVRCLVIDVALASPFVTAFVGANHENVELFVRLAAAFSLSLIMVEDATGTSPSFALHFMNTLLRDAFIRT